VKDHGASDWDNNSFTITFPGQGLWFPDNTYFVCAAQGISDATENPPNYAADIECKATFNYADVQAHDAPVQSIRTPYIDQRFVGVYSALTPHTNTTSVARPVLGVWNYAGTFATSLIQCLGTKLANTSSWGQQCSTYDSSNNENPAPVKLLKPGYEFKPGDQIGGQCAIAAGNNDRGTICASYFFISVPVVNGQFDPIDRNETITASDRNNFCESDTSKFAFTDGSNGQACKSTLQIR
jgi:hypothetical protein